MLLLSPALFNLFYVEDVIEKIAGKNDKNEGGRKVVSLRLAGDTIRRCKEVRRDLQEMSETSGRN